MLEEEIKRRLSYNPETGIIIWNKIEENNKFDKRFNNQYAGKVAGAIDSHGYRHIKLGGKTFLAHRVAWFLCYGTWPEEHLDHINRVRLDNRITNLREVTRQGNARNQPIRKDNKSGVTGVYFDKESGKWIACIFLNGKNVKIGRFTNKDRAIEARVSAEMENGFHENHGKIL